MITAFGDSAAQFRVYLPQPPAMDLYQHQSGWLPLQLQQLPISLAHQLQQLPAGAQVLHRVGGQVGVVGVDDAQVLQPAGMRQRSTRPSPALLM